MTRDEWLAERRTGIGSSDAAAVCGLSPWRQPLAVYLDKLGLLPDGSKPAMRWGLKLEETIATAYAETTGREVTLPAQIMRHPRHPWMLASLDRVAGDRIVELKTSRTDEGWGAEGTDDIPEAYMIQVQHQMSVAAIDIADVAVLIGGNDFRIYAIQSNRDVQRRLIDIEEAFWDHVIHRRPPELDWSDPRTPGLVELLHQPREEECVDLDMEMLDRVAKYERLGAIVNKIHNLRNTEKARIAEAMGAAAIGYLPDGRAVTRKRMTRKAHQVGTYSFVDFRISKRGKRT